MTTSSTDSTTRRLAALLALALLGAFWPGDAAAHSCDDPFSTDLIAGRTIDAGNVEVCNDDATLTITYEATFPWCLLETHLHVATIPDPPAEPDANIPQTGTGNPTPDEFAYGDEHDCAGTAAFEIPLDEIDGGVSPGDTVVIAAHAEVEDGARTEGAWGEGTRFVERGNWAMYFTYAVQEAAVPCPQACVAGLEVFADRVSGDPLVFAICEFRAASGTPFVAARYFHVATLDTPDALVTGSRCRARFLDETLVDLELSNAESVSCAPLAIDILPLVDETNCDISPP